VRANAPRAPRACARAFCTAPLQRCAVLHPPSAPTGGR
jgi:hypothetical protein